MNTPYDLAGLDQQSLQSPSTSHLQLAKIHHHHLRRYAKTLQVGRKAVNLTCSLPDLRQNADPKTNLLEPNFEDRDRGNFRRGKDYYYS